MIPIGIHYEYPFGGMAKRPEWLPKGEADWHRDIEAIKDTGFNSIRIRIGMDSNLDEVAALLDIIHQAGMTVQFGSALFYVNDEFVEKYPDSKIIGADGEVCPVDTADLRWQRACIDHPAYHELRNEILDGCASRFHNHPAVIAWCIHNEPSLGPLVNPCFCENTLAKYRAAAEDEFHTALAFNGKFGTNFDSFDVIRPPAERNIDNVEFFDHWRVFETGNLNAFLLEGRDIVARHVGSGLITHNVTQHFGMSNSGQDWWVCRDYNLLSMSKYIGTTENSVSSSHGYEFLKAINPEKPHWVTEFQGGPFDIPGLSKLYSGKEAEIELNGALSHGMKAVYFYRWTPLMGGAEPWINGMTEPDSYDTDRRLGVQKAICALQPDLDLIDRAVSFAPSIGIYQSRDQVIRNPSDKISAITKATNGAYGVLSDLGYEAAFIVHGPEKLSDFDAVIFPYTNTFTDHELDSIENYLSDGGSAIIDLPVGFPDMAEKIAARFGVRAEKHQSLRYLLCTGWSLRGTGNGLDLDKGSFAGYCFDERLSLGGENRVMQYDDNAEAAAVMPPKYEGRLLITGCRLFYSYGLSLHKNTRRVVGAFLKELVAPDFTLEGADEEFRPYLEARVLEDKSSREALLFLINRCPHKSYDLKVAVKGYDPVRVTAPSFDVVRIKLKM
ncbi:MAG: hypothetical protein HN368_16880 [Spirochaetales bacterium]|jgi:hypothetical protein|nr:hypothetical protein [Spirochaetales bacterium]